MPVSVARMEDDEDGSPLRFYGQDGKEIRVPTPAEIAARFPDAPFKRTRDAASALLQASPAPRPGATGTDWAASVLAPPGKKDDRRKSFERQFGQPKGQVGKVDRYAAFAPDGTTREVLVSPEHALPTDMKVTRAGVLLSHTTFEYEPQADGSQLRRACARSSACPTRRTIGWSLKSSSGTCGSTAKAVRDDPPHRARSGCVPGRAAAVECGRCLRADRPVVFVRPDVERGTWDDAIRNWVPRCRFRPSRRVFPGLRPTRRSIELQNQLWPLDGSTIAVGHSNGGLVARQ